MKNIWRSFAVALALLAFPLAVSAWQEEILKGTYVYRSKDLSISFIWGDDGVERLRINGRSYPDAKYDNLGMFGNSALIEIRVEEKPTSLKVIELLFFVDGKKPLVVSGYYADIRNMREDGSFTPAVSKSIEMRYQKRGSRNRLESP
jgi:hypothetical protein